MTENPIVATFELQRTAVEQGRQAAVEAVDAQKTAVDAFVDGLETTQQAQQQGVRLSHEAAHAVLDALEQVNPEVELAELRDLVEESFQNVEDAQDDAWNAVIDAAEEGAGAFEEAADTYNELLDTTFDSYLAAHEHVEATAGEFEEIDVTPS